MRTQPKDQVVIGAGPVGVLASLALAEKGHHVSLVDGDPSFTCSFAGEWLHPEGLRLLKKYGVDLTSGTTEQTAEAKGFVVYPDDGSQPILLDNPGGHDGLAFERSYLMKALRSKCEENECIDWTPHAKVTGVEEGALQLELVKEGRHLDWTTDRIIGADGRKSIVRRSHGPQRSSHLISYMVGVLIRDTQLPHEGYGHVFLGGPGPVLVYRIGENAIRVCIDAPQDDFRSSKDKALALRDHLTHLPGHLAEPIRARLAAGDFAVRANQFRSRVFYGDSSRPLVGDAVGFHHPLTAMGMTLGFEDVDCLVNSRSFQDFERERLSRTLVPELLALALYEAFSRNDSGAASVRSAVYRMWRNYGVERERTMRLLCGEEKNLLRFGQSLLRGVQLALVSSVLHRGPLSSMYQETLGTLGSIGKILYVLSKPSSSRIL
ncbi:MAG: NAD(P)/FAD-dependent oxidoreductase, partial [Verrucomicrobiota bacterium]